MKIETPFDVIEVLQEEEFPEFGYVLRRELIYNDLTEDNMEMDNCYSMDTGHWIGGMDGAKHKCEKLGLRHIQKRNPSHSVASIGFNEEEQRWYGWSHRAMVSFGIGDRIFEEGYGDDLTIFIEHGPVVIETMSQAKLAACNFAEYMS